MSQKGAATIAEATSGRRPPRRAIPIEIAEDRGIAVVAAIDPPPVAASDERLVLAPGVAYVLRVGLRLAGTGEAAFSARGDLEMRASWDGDASIRVDEGATEVPISALSHDRPLGAPFELAVSERAPRTAGRFAVTAVDQETRLTHTIYERSVAIEAELHSPPAGFSTATSIRLDRELDPRLAVLHVYAGPEDRILVDGFHPRLAPLQGKTIARPTLDFGIAEREHYPAYMIVDHVIDYSRRGLTGIQGWLKEVVASAGDGLAIIVAEHVDARVPWEMLALEDRTVLGTRAVVTRWTAITSFGQAIELDPSFVHGGSGRVLSYLDHLELDQAVLERALEACGHDACPDLFALRRRLQDELGRLALVMLACHGIFARDEVHEVQVGSLANPHKRISRLDLVQLARPAEPRPLVFVNACHSARLSRDQLGIAGLPEVFLGGFARGYLGTIGAVSQQVAAEIGARILAEARSDGGVCLPQLLLELRRKAAEARVHDPQTFVDTFLYVFYGSPRDRLALDPADSTGGGDG